MIRKHQSALTKEGLPKDTKSLALILEDPDAPFGTFDHWVVWNIEPLGFIDEDSIPGMEGHVLARGEIIGLYRRR